MSLFREKPRLVDARRWQGDLDEGRALAAWCHGRFEAEVLDINGDVFRSARIRIDSVDGPWWATAGGWVLQHTNGRFYTLTDEAFHARYERAEGAW